MAKVLDVAAYILRKQGRMTAMKLQKLVYYCQAWSLVWDDGPLFKNRIEAWAEGPVVPTLYRAHRGQYKIRRLVGGNARRLSKQEKDTVNAVLGYYGDKTSQWLSDLTHAEDPWKKARGKLPPGAISHQAIPCDFMASYYSSLR